MTRIFIAACLGVVIAGAIHLVEWPTRFTAVVSGAGASGFMLSVTWDYKPPPARVMPAKDEI